MNFDLQPCKRHALMRKLLLNEFIGIYTWVALCLMTAPNAIAGSFPSADTCQHPDPPIITGSAKAICRNELVTLTSTGCTGTVVWSNGDIGNAITIKPQQTTKYTAICRAKQGCISCFAEVWKVTVNTPNTPVIKSSSMIVCPGEPVTLTAFNCAGVVHWSDQSTGAIWTGTLHETTTFQATCEQNSCVSNPSIALAVQVAVPTAPRIAADKQEICAGQAVQLVASGCRGIVLWVTVARDLFEP